MIKAICCSCGNAIRISLRHLIRGIPLCNIPSCPRFQQPLEIQIPRRKS